MEYSLIKPKTMTLHIRIATARIFYAISLIAFGVQHILFDDFIAGRAPAWSPSLPGQLFWAYATGLLMIMAGIATILDRKARLGLTIAGVLIISWAAGRNIYELLLAPQYGGLLTNLFKSLTIGFGAFIAGQSFRESEFSPTLDNFISRMAAIGVYMVGMFLLVGGIQHFIFVDFVQFLVPTWIPGSTFWTYFSGIALIAGGAGIVLGIKRSLAALLSGLMVFTWFLVLHLPRAIENRNQNEWTAVFEALAVSGILFLIAYREHEEG